VRLASASTIAAFAPELVDQDPVRPMRRSAVTEFDPKKERRHASADNINS
jgi:hypothetical protein